MEAYELLGKLGQGTYGAVYSGRERASGRAVAVKLMRLEEPEEGLPAGLLREMSILGELVHPGVVRLLAVHLGPDRVHLVFEHLQQDLRRRLDGLGAGQLLPARLVLAYMRQLAAALSHCHRCGLLHRDLKPQNLLVDAAGSTIKLADFGLARLAGRVHRPLSHEVVTLWYRAPELLLAAPDYSFPVDVWSMGCVFAEMATRRPLFPGDSEIGQLFEIFKVLRTPNEDIWPGISRLTNYKVNFPEWDKFKLEEKVPEMSKEGFDLLKAMLTYCPCCRITAQGMERHPYMRTPPN